MSNFPDYAGPLTETILAGNLAVWLADPEAAGNENRVGCQAHESQNVPDLDGVVKPKYRQGYTL